MLRVIVYLTELHPCFKDVRVQLSLTGRRFILTDLDSERTLMMVTCTKFGVDIPI